MGIDAETPLPERRFSLGPASGTIHHPLRKPSGLRVKATLAM